MDEEKQTSGKNKKILVILIIAIVVISASTAIGYYYWNFKDINEDQPNEPVLTTTYSALSPLEAYDLINTSEQFIVIDVRNPCPCNWDTDHIGLNNTFRALKRTEPEFSEFFNETSDIIIYDEYGGNTAIEWGEGLVNHTYGKICYIIGGFPSWRDVYKFPTLSPEE